MGEVEDEAVWGKLEKCCVTGHFPTQKQDIGS